MAFATWSPPKPPQLGTRKRLTQSIYEATFGDDYEQVAGNGLTSKRKLFPLVWNGLADADADTIEAFVISKGYVTPFWYTPPGEGSPLKFRFVRDSYDRNQIAGSADSITVEIRQVFDIEI